MNPSAIIALTQICERQYQASSKDTGHLISTFLTTWGTWEAVRIRLLRVIIHKQGWLIQDADAALRQAKLSSMKNAASLLHRLGLPDPSNWKGQSGQIWRTLLSIEPLRHRLTHGFQTADPKLIKAATAVVLEAVSNQEWLEDLVLPSTGNVEDRNRLGPIMSPRGVKGKRDRRSRKELFVNLGLEDSKATSSLPSLSLLERRLNSMRLEE
jgi:hypothetical protein